MARKRIIEAPALKSWEDVNDALRQIAEAQITLGDIESEMQKQIVGAKKAAEQQTEQQAKAAAPRSRKGRNDRNDSSRRGRRSDPYARFEKNEPRVDAHTPSRAYALSDEAAARIRRKVEAALAARAAKADGKAAPQQEKKGRGHGSRSAQKPAPQQNKTAQSKTTNHRHRRRRTPNNNRKG